MPGSENEAGSSCVVCTLEKTKATAPTGRRPGSLSAPVAHQQLFPTDRPKMTHLLMFSSLPVPVPQCEMHSTNLESRSFGNKTDLKQRFLDTPCSCCRVCLLLCRRAVSVQGALWFPDCHTSRKLPSLKVLASHSYQSPSQKIKQTQPKHAFSQDTVDVKCNWRNIGPQGPSCTSANPSQR